ncbi:MAG TPA: dihydroneopterin aldolase [Candidatus Eremiobacteraceae bacterium]|nr:dihydroneopterin aldolase [Candidatus Eremiobacteraceae bacterium]
MSNEASQNSVIRINGMRFFGKHGANAGERDRDQPIDVDLEISVNLERAAISDALKDTVDYGALYRTCEQIVTQQSFALLEALADRIVQAVCQDSRVIDVIVRVRKPRLLEGATPEVELRRKNKKRI